MCVSANNVCTKILQLWLPLWKWFRGNRGGETIKKLEREPSNYPHLVLWDKIFFKSIKLQVQLCRRRWLHVRLLMIITESRERNCQHLLWRRINAQESQLFTVLTAFKHKVLTFESSKFMCFKNKSSSLLIFNKVELICNLPTYT